MPAATGREEPPAFPTERSSFSPVVPRNQVGQPLFRLGGWCRGACRGVACRRGPVWSGRDEARTCAAVTGLCGTVRTEVDSGGVVEVGELTGVDVEEVTCVDAEEFVPDALGAGTGCTWAEPLCGCGGASGCGSTIAGSAANAMRKSAQPRRNSRQTTIRVALTT